MNKTERITVIAPPGLICPSEIRGMIDDKKPVPVPLTRYYQRLLGEGSLLRVDTKKEETHDTPQKDASPQNASKKNNSVSSKKEK